MNLNFAAPRPSATADMRTKFQEALAPGKNSWDLPPPVAPTAATSRPWDARPWEVPAPAPATVNANSTPTVTGWTNMQMLKWGVIAAVVIAVIILGIYFFMKWKNGSSKPEAPVQAPPRPMYQKQPPNVHIPPPSQPYRPEQFQQQASQAAEPRLTPEEASDPNFTSLTQNVSQQIPI